MSRVLRTAAVRRQEPGSIEAALFLNPQSHDFGWRSGTLRRERLVDG